ncbi:MAG TPA: PHB depolymerase family esterase [Caulobacteraceae bacterium]|nr:PHB depolymerase family esterase [Caulobacteraceae bacterium]
MASSILLQRAWTLLALIVGLVFAPAAGAIAADATLTLNVGGVERTAYLHAPDRIDPARRYPLVIGFHGGAGNAEGYIENSQLFAKGEAAGFIVVCPQGTPIPIAGDHRVWNSGPEYERSSHGTDDVAFTRLIIDQVSRMYAIDPKRVFVTGFSNGGQMAYRLALELPDRIAAIAPMSGGRLAGDERPARPVPVMHFHGAADTVYPLGGGLGPNSIGRTPHASIDEVIDEWRQFDGADPTSTIEPHDGWEVHRHAGAAPVLLVLVLGMGHQIAGGRDDRLPGQAMRDQPDAIAMALQFFNGHPMP